MSSHRIPQLNELIRHELSKILLKEVSLPTDCLTTITKVNTSKDLSQSKIHISVMPTEKQQQILNLLHKQARHLQFILAQTIVVRKIPNLLFQIDNTHAKIGRIDELIDKIHQQG